MFFQQRIELSAKSDRQLLQTGVILRGAIVLPGLNAVS